MVVSVAKVFWCRRGLHAKTAPLDSVVCASKQILAIHLTGLDYEGFVHTFPKLNLILHLYKLKAHMNQGHNQKLLPLNRGRWLSRDIVDHAVNTANLIDDAV